MIDYCKDAKVLKWLQQTIAIHKSILTGDRVDHLVQGPGFDQGSLEAGPSLRLPCCGGGWSLINPVIGDTNI